MMRARPGTPKQYEADIEAQITTLACSAPPPGVQRWTILLLSEPARAPPQDEVDQPEDHPPGSKVDLKPRRRVMRCIRELTEEYRRRMYELLSLYARPHDPTKPVVWMYEKSKQLLR